MIERHEKLMNIVKESKRIPLRELAGQLNVSEITVRRDLKEIEASHEYFLKNSIVYYKQPEIIEFPHKKFIANQKEKALIAKEVVKVLEPGDVVAIDIGSTNHEITKALMDFQENLIVFTPSLETAYLLSNNEFLEVYMIPGLVRKNRYSVVGTLANEFLNAFHIDYFFLGAAGIDEGNVYDYIIEEVEIKKRLIKQSKNVFLVADHTKFGRKALIKICTLKEISEIITDDLPKQYQNDYSKTVKIAGGD